MKTKIILLLSAVALVTLSFTFSVVNAPVTKEVQNIGNSNGSEPVGGFVADQIVK